MRGPDDDDDDWYADLDRDQDRASQDERSGDRDDNPRGEPDGDY